ncbi:MAG: PEGA domain-containing protein, partial [Calditrichaeota bacterium]
MRPMRFMLLVCLIGLVVTNGYSQELAAKSVDKRIIRQAAEQYVPMGEALANLEKVFDVHIVYDDEVIQGKTAPLLASSTKNLQEALRLVLGEAPITYKKIGRRTVVLQPMELPQPAPAPAGGTIKGKVTDETGVGLPLAQVLIEGTNLGDAADDDGNYEITNVPPGTYTLSTRVIGYKTMSAQVTVNADEVVTQDFSLASDILSMDEVVTTATRSPVQKKSSSVAITTMSPKEISQAAPRSTADLLKAIPGFYVESSGGEVGGNLFARGLPADGSFRYVALMEEGMPVYDSTELFFINADIFVRVDANIERVEAVRGGNAALFGSNAPGGVINFISKTGGPILSGTVKAEAATDALNRYDFNINGPLAENLFFSIGGFYRFDDGVRDPGFPSSKGGQVKANFTRIFDNGYFKVYGKYLNDSNIFYLPVPIEADVRGDKQVLTTDFVPGFPDDGTLTTAEANLLRVPMPNLAGGIAGEFTMPLEDGQKQIGGSVIADFGFELPNDWSIQ